MNDFIISFNINESTNIFNLFLHDTVNIIWLGIGLFIAGVLEAFLWKTPPFQLLNFPIQKDWFGANKKWRGLVSLPLTMIVSTYLLQIIEKFIFPTSTNWILFSNFNFIFYGLSVGFIFNLSELPNSFIKRRLEIPPGDESNKFFYIIDHIDSTYGVLLLWYFFWQIPLHLILTGAIVAPLLFMGATWLRKLLGLK
jgi:hypothetical protein